MQRISRDEFDDLTRGASVLSADEHGSKVLLLADDRVVKLFRRKRWLSSALIWPYARRFAWASQELARRGIDAPIVERCARAPSVHRDIVIYRRIAGTPLRAALASSGGDHGRLLMALAHLLATLHQRGVYFRAAHFANVLVRQHSPDALQMSLIDISEAQFRSCPLSPAMRARNFRPLTRYAEDREAIRSFGVRQFVRQYLDSAKLSVSHEARFLSALRGTHSMFTDA